MIFYSRPALLITGMLATVAVAATVAFTAASSARAQEPESVTDVIVPKSTLEADPGSASRDEYANLAEAFKEFTVLADGERCGVLSLVASEARDAEGNARFELGRGERPAACAREGALITFVNSFFHNPPATLHEKFEWFPGEPIVLDIFAPEAPATGPATPGAPAAGASVVAQPARSTPQTALAIGTLLLLSGVVLYVVSRRHALRQ